MNLKDRVAIISGASQGLGFEIAKHFLHAGARVMICARGKEALSAAEQALKSINNVNVISKITDISQPKEVDALIAETVKQFGKIDILVANAGIHGPKGTIDAIDWDEWSTAIDINLKGTVLQCRAVLPHFKRQQSSKIIILSGGGATKPMPNLSAYAASKAAIVRFAETLAEEVKSYGIAVNAVAPGALNTRLLEDILSAGPERVGQVWYNQALKQQENGGTSLALGASLCTFLASEESDGITGRLLSAVWDPWEQLSQFKEQLQHSDIYTLRRIIPSDRGFNWGEPT